MRYLYYTNYRSGHSGLSNGIMSVECGVVLAFLTNRFLVLDGNVSPPANIVSYGGRVSNDTPSRVTDLIDLPIPWAEPHEVDLDGLQGRELTDEHFSQMVFYAPSSLDITSRDALAFARGRKAWLTTTPELTEIPILKVTEYLAARDEERERTNLSFYSYLFYLNDETRHSVYRLLQRMKPKAALADLAKKVAADLGPFNAVHLRRGDFKVTYGVTTLDRHPWEAIEAMDHHFSRAERLVIVTDEKDDPFFKEIMAAYPDHVFIDHHLLDAYGNDFDELPTKDSLALAYLSQLVAAESKDFIGTMTSTFTAMIQRYRGNRGKHEPFKFLWNELPDPRHRQERGRHPVSDCVPLERGIMLEEQNGPYSWNRFSQRIAPAWMREWPESFLTENTLTTGAMSGAGTAPGAGSLVAAATAGMAGSPRIFVSFDGVRVSIQSNEPSFGLRLTEAFAVRPETSPENVVGDLEISAGDGYTLFRNGQEIVRTSNADEALRSIKHEMVPILSFARPRHTWLEGMAFSRDGKALVVAGDSGDDDDQLADALCSSGWDLLWDDVIPIRVEDSMVVPFGRSSWPKGARARNDPSEMPLAALVVSELRLKARDAIARLSPAVATAELIARSIDFRFDRDKAVRRLCRIVEQRPVFQLSFSRSEQAAELLSELDLSPSNPALAEATP